MQTEFKNLEEKMRKTFEFAKKGECLAFPNPNVACLIYHQEKLIASGVHQYYGHAHAEVIAINQFKEHYANSKELQAQYQSMEELASACELILNLEPCSHYGNTPPCTGLIKASGFKKIAFAAYDTNPKVFKRSLELFASPDYTLVKPEDLSPELQKQAKSINRAFFKIKEKENKNQLAVYLTLKVASYADGSMITKADDEWISSETSRRDVHRLRATSQVVITTSETIKQDKPRYTVRYDKDSLDLLDLKDPDLCILYKENKIQFTDDAKDRKVFYEKLASLDSEALLKLVTKLNSEGYQKIMIEAGPTLSHAFLDSGLLDEFVIYQNKSSRDTEEFVRDVSAKFQCAFENSLVEDFGEDYKLVFVS